MILFNSNVIDYLNLSIQFVWSDEIKESNRLFYFYFGFSFIGIASILFQVFCPKVIRVNKDSLESVEYGMVLVSGRRIQRIMELINVRHEKMQKVRDWMPPQTKDFIKRLNDIYKQGKLKDVDLLEVMPGFKIGDPAKKYEEQREFQKRTLHVSWTLCEIINRKTRFLILALYSVGFLLLAIPTIDTFVRVCIAFGTRLFT